MCEILQNEVVIGSIIGASAVIIPQVLIYLLNNKKNKKQEILEIKSEIHRVTFLLKDHYRELAMHKAHKYYWSAQYQYGELNNSNEKEIEKCHTFHMNASSRVRDTEIKIAESFSQYNKLIIKIQYLTKFNNNIKNLILEYENYIPNKPKDYYSPTQSDLYKLSGIQEKQLTDEYKNHIQTLEKINTIIEKI